MTEQWPNHGRDLHLELDRRHVRASLEEALRDAVRQGRLTPRTILPSLRSLAADLAVARNTVVDVYGQLVVEGWLVRASAKSVHDSAKSLIGRRLSRA